MEIQPYSSFWQRIHQTAKAKGFPLRAMFELTYRCNFRCKHCYVPYSYRKKRELETQEVFFILRQLAEAGCFYLGFTGGEPFTRKDIIDILWYAKKKGFEIIIYSNGSLINKEITKELQRIGPNKVDITIPALSKRAFERITQMPGSHRKVLDAIDLLHNKGIRLGFKTCVLKGNESEIKDIQDFAASLGALHRLDDMLSPCLDGSREPYRFRGQMRKVVSRKSYLVRRKSEIRKGKNELLGCPTIKLLNWRKKTNSLFGCGAGVTQVAITPLGELKMCLMIDYPKFKILDEQAVGRRSYVVCRKSEVRSQKADLKEAWEKLKELVASIKPDENYQCDKCKLEPYCKWCPANGWLYSKSFTACVPENRRWAEAKS